MMEHDKSFKIVEIVGRSDESFSAATEQGVAAAAGAHEQPMWCEAIELRGRREGTTVEYQVTLKVGLRDS